MEWIWWLLLISLVVCSVPEGKMEEDTTNKSSSKMAKIKEWTPVAGVALAFAIAFLSVTKWVFKRAVKEIQ